MSYCASGSGEVALKKKVSEDILELLNSSYVGFETEDSPDGGLWLTFYYDKYHEDEVIDALNKLAPYTKSGDIEFTGEDNTRWRFHFENGKMEEQDGETAYKSTTKKKRTFNVDYYHSEGGGQTQVDIEDGNFEDMVNEILSLVYQITDDSKERNVEIYHIKEVPYDGEEE